MWVIVRTSNVRTEIKMRVEIWNMKGNSAKVSVKRYIALQPSMACPAWNIVTCLDICYFWSRNCRILEAACRYHITQIRIYYDELLAGVLCLPMPHQGTITRISAGTSLMACCKNTMLLDARYWKRGWEWQYKQYSCGCTLVTHSFLYCTFQQLLCHY